MRNYEAAYQAYAETTAFWPPELMSSPDHVRKLVEAIVDAAVPRDPHRLTLEFRTIEAKDTFLDHLVGTYGVGLVEVRSPDAPVPEGEQPSEIIAWDDDRVEEEDEVRN